MLLGNKIVSKTKLKERSTKFTDIKSNIKWYTYVTNIDDRTAE